MFWCSSFVQYLDIRWQVWPTAPSTAMALDKFYTAHPRMNYGLHVSYWIIFELAPMPRFHLRFQPWTLRGISSEIQILNLYVSCCISFSQKPDLSNCFEQFPYFSYLSSGSAVYLACLHTESIFWVIS